MRFLKAVALLLLLASKTVAQHSATLSIQPSASTGVASYNVYRAPCTGIISNGVCSVEGAFVKVGSVAATVSPLKYVDASVVAGGNYSYYTTAVCPTTNCSTSVGGESVASNHMGIAVALDSPQAPVLLNILSAVLTRQGANAQFSVSYVDTPGYQTSWTLVSSNTTIASGTKTSTTGNYSNNWSGKINPGITGFLFQVCDQAGSCASRKL